MPTSSPGRSTSMCGFQRRFGGSVAILIRFTPSGLTRDPYRSASKKLEGGGHCPPPGLLAHVCFVSEVWESREQQEQFAQAGCPFSKKKASAAPTRAHKARNGP
jgi:hypothetical protein